MCDLAAEAMSLVLWRAADCGVNGVSDAVYKSKLPGAKSTMRHLNAMCPIRFLMVSDGFCEKWPGETQPQSESFRAPGCHSTPPGQFHVSQHGQGAGTSDKLKWLAENGLLPLQPHQVTSAGLPLKDGKP